MSKAATRFTSIEEIRVKFYPRMARLLDLDPREHIGLWRLPDDVEKAVREQLSEDGKQPETNGDRNA